MRTRQTQGRTWQTPRRTWQVRGPSSSKCRPIGGLFLFVFREWSQYPDRAPKRKASKPCIKMDSSESWHFAQLSTQAFGNMAPLGRPLPPLSGFRPTLEAKFSAQSGYFDHNAENARSDFRHSQKSIHCARRNFDFYSFAGKRGPQGNSDAQIGHTLGHSRGGTQCPPTPPTAGIAEWACASSAACVPSTARIEHRIRA